MTQDRSIEDRVDSFPEPWKPKVGDKLVGTVLEVDARDSEFSEEPYPIVVVSTDDGRELAFHGFHTVAMRELSRQRPRSGDRIAVKYFGRTEGERGYERYRVLVERAESPGDTEPDWDGMEAAAAAELGELPMPEVR